MLRDKSFEYSLPGLGDVEAVFHNNEE